ncbi:MAG: hypothetical protein CME13_20825 [Gemmatimonadetes bacterium]|nr:hypothetical protein [Gemmatimonadota bacterium]
MKRKTMGRPTKLTKPVQDRIVELLENGNYQVTAAKVVGISRSTLSRWLQLGAEHEATDEDSIYRSFRTAVKRAEAAAEVKAVECVVNSWEKTWTSAMTYLERKHPGRWSRGERRELSGTIEKPVQNLSVLTDEELDTLLVLTAKVEGIKGPVH